MAKGEEVNRDSAAAPASELSSEHVSPLAWKISLLILPEEFERSSVMRADLPVTGAYPPAGFVMATVYGVGAEMTVRIVQLP